MTTDDAFRYCTALAKSHYENFHVATWLLPRRLRLPFYTIYAYCRCSDDIADKYDGVSVTPQMRADTLQKLDVWQSQLDTCFDITAKLSDDIHPVFTALRQIAAEYQLPKQPFANLLVAFRQDQTTPQYETYDQLLDYCRYSANPVGRMVLYLVCQPTAQQCAWSDSICTALQLANFWQDVQQDGTIGRCYIPQDIAARHGIVLTNLQDTPPFRAAIRELVADARQRFQTGMPLVDSVPKEIRTDVRLFIDGGLAVLDAIKKINYGVLAQRPALSRWTKLWLLLRAAFLY